MLWVLEGGLDIDALAARNLEALLHPLPVRDDVEAPLLEIGDLVLRLADYDLYDSFIQPPRLPFQLGRLKEKHGPHGFIFRRRRFGVFPFGCSPDRCRFGLPARHDPLVHPRAGDLIDADE